MALRREKHPLEKAARALCRFHQMPEDTRYQGKPMWHRYAYDALVVLEAALPREELLRLVPDYPTVDLDKL